MATYDWARRQEQLRNGRILIKKTIEVLEKIAADKDIQDEVKRELMEERLAEVAKMRQEKEAEPVRITDKSGNPITLTPYQKQELYRQACQLRQEILDGMLTQNQCWTRNEYNTDLMVKREFPLTDKIKKYKKLMQAIGADPQDRLMETFRRK